MDYELLIDAVNDLNREFTVGDTIDEYKLIGDFYSISVLLLLSAIWFQISTFISFTATGKQKKRI